WRQNFWRSWSVPGWPWANLPPPTSLIGRSPSAYAAGPLTNKGAHGRPCKSGRLVELLGRTAAEIARRALVEAGIERIVDFLGIDQVDQDGGRPMAHFEGSLTDLRMAAARF